MALNIVPLRPLPPIEPEAAASTPAITIITPSLNRAEWVERAVYSVLEQNYPRLQHIVADGGSTDGTLERLEAFPHLTILRGPDRNSHHAMNKGITASTGSIIGFLNTDDYYWPGALWAVARRFVAQPKLAALRGRCLLAEAGCAPDQELLHDEHDPWGELLFGAPGFNSWFFRRDLLTQLGGVDDRLEIAADRDLLIRMALAGERPPVLGEVVYVYQRHRGSATLDGEGRLAMGLLDEHVTLALRLRDKDRPHLDAFLAFEMWQLVVRLIRARRWAKLGGLILRMGGALTAWPQAMGRARRWRRRLANRWRAGFSEE